MPVDAYDRSDIQLLTSGNLLTADNQIDTTTGTGKLKAVFDNNDSVLFPNQFVNIHLILENRPKALVVPTAAVQTGLNGSLFVWVINDDGKGGQVAQMQPVKVALAEGQNTILDSGPAPGTNVVIDGADRLRPGQPVSVGSARQRQAGAGSPGAQPAGTPSLKSGKTTTVQTPQNPSSNQRQHQ
jgi:multidrug efflux system membrane fusion protein